ARIPTAFTATVGSGTPVIGILGEFDALPGLTQEAVPFRQPRPGHGFGHGCGHHLFGTASATACLPIAAQLHAGKLTGPLRIHHVITDGGGAPNVVPDFAEVYYYLRHPKADVVRALYPRLVKCAQAGALATETKLEVMPEGGIVEMLPNTALAAVAKANLMR